MLEIRDNRGVIPLPLQFSAAVICGAGRGKTIGTPTLNVDLSQVPAELPEGIYAALVAIDGEWLPAAMHYGPRPVFKDSVSCEFHIVDRHVPTAPEHLDVRVLHFLRQIKDFPSPEILAAQIAFDVDRVRHFTRLPPAS